MDENRQDRDFKQTDTNNEAESVTSRKTRHTWIGDRDEIRPDFAERPVSRATFTDSSYRDTRMVQREKKPYRGFITDEEVKNAEAAAEIDRRAREESMAARATMTQTRVYSGFGSSIADEVQEDTAKSADPKPAEKPAAKRRRRTFSIDTSDSNKVRRLIIIMMVFLLLIAYEISFVVMKAGLATLPGKTSKLKSEIATLQADNSEMKKSEEELGEYGDIKDLRDSWQILKEKITE